MRGGPGSAATPFWLMSMSVLARSATARPAKLANDPPLSNKPVAAGSNPTMALSQSMTRCSTAVADGADRHDVTFWLSAEARKSAATPAKLPDDCT